LALGAALFTLTAAPVAEAQVPPSGQPVPPPAQPAPPAPMAAPAPAPAPAPAGDEVLFENGDGAAEDGAADEGNYQSRPHRRHRRGHMGPGRGATRPADPTIGLGFGYALPTSWDGPNVTSARFRMASGLTIEPRVELSYGSTTVDTGADDTSDSRLGISLAALGRLPLVTRGRVDLVGVGG